MNGASEAQGATSMLRFKPYSAYRNSGVDWLGEIPSHWSISRLKHLAALNPESLPEETDPAREMTYVDIGGVDSLGRIVEKQQLTFASAPTRARRLVRNGDVIVSTVRTYLRAIAQIHDPEPEMVVSTGFAVVRPADGLSAAYAAYALRAPYFVDRVVANSKGVSFPAINESEMATYVLAVPPEAEQPAIATFLDRETAKIDALVAKNERLIELLQENRTALITRAVTRGLDPTVYMKDSGVEWLGEIPKHWKVKPLKAISVLQTGLTLGKKYEVGGLTKRPYLRVVNVQDGFLALDDIAEVDLPPKDAIRFELRPGDVLVTEGGDFDKLGRGYVWEGQIKDCLHQNHIFAVRPIYGRLRPRFLASVMSSGYGRAYFTATSKQSTNLASTNSTTLGNLPMPVPGLVEQDEILASLDSEMAKLDGLIANVSAAIARIKELRTALISAAVTGKIDVREEAA